MLGSVFSVSKELGKICDPKDLTLQQITEMFKNITVVDQIYFAQYDTPPENPIWGEFTRWSHQPSVYSSFATSVEIRYAAHLLSKEDWLRLVVTKELCHSLEAPSGQHDVTAAAMTGLASKFSVLSHQKAVDDFDGAYRLELLAEIGAVELLCPLEVRKKIVSSGQPDTEQCKEIAVKYKLPLPYVVESFKPENMVAVEYLIETD